MNDSPDDILETLFDPTKTEILKMLQDGPMTSIRIATELSLTDPDAVEELQALVQAGVIKEFETPNGVAFELTLKASVAQMLDEALGERVKDDLDIETGEQTED